jgi:hypothetical protein
LEYPVDNFDDLRDLAADVRAFIESSRDPAAALRNVVAAYDVVLGIYPSDDGMGLHVVKGSSLLDRLATLQSNALYTHTAVAVQNREQAVQLQTLIA